MATTVQQFFDLHGSTLELQVLHGAQFMGRRIPEEAINRPGLALTGFYQYFANKRVQVLGLAEMTYLNSLKGSEQRTKLEALFQRNIPCVVLTRNRTMSQTMRDLSLAYRIPVLRTSMITSRFINGATIGLEDMVAPSTRIAGCMLDILGVGVLIAGKPGIGKSEAALGLIERGHSLVSDDVTEIRKDSRGKLMGSAPESTRYHMEIRGLGIIHVPSLFGMASITREQQLKLVVQLYRMDPRKEGDRSGLVKKTRKVLDLPVPLIEVPVAPGRDMAGVIEVAAMNQKLESLGHSAAKEFDQQLIAGMKAKLKKRKRALEAAPST